LSSQLIAPSFISAIDASHYLLRHKMSDISSRLDLKKSKISRAIPVFGKEELRSFSESNIGFPEPHPSDAFP
jgi:hypothetical protein